MKQFYIFCVSLISTLTLNAQIIDFPDANFKAALIAEGFDTNDDGEIQVSEAEARNGLYVSNQSISSLVGIEYFINLTNLSCRNNNLTTLDLSALSNLTSLTCDTNQLTELNLTGLIDLIYIDCSRNELTELDVNSFTNLHTLFCYDNNISLLEINSLVNLNFLSCSNNQLTNLDITNSPNLESFDCSYNNLNSIDLSTQSYFENFVCSGNNLTSLNLTNLDYVGQMYANNNQLTSINLCEIKDYLHVYGNLLTELDVSNSTTLEEVICNDNLITSLDISNNPLVTSVYVANNELTSLTLGNGEALGWCCDVLFEGNPDLSFVCTIEDNFDEVQTLLTEYGYTSCTISSYCSFEPYGEYYVIEGLANYDENSDGCDASDSSIPHLQYNITSNDIYDNFISNAIGDYTIYVDSGEHVISPTLENPSYFTVTPSEITVDFPTDTSPFIQDFCVTPNGTYNDLEIAIIPIDLARPGFDTDYKVIYKNKGNTTLSGNINFGFEDDVMTFVSSTPPNESGVPDLLQWIFTDLVPFESREIDLTMNLNAPTETPPLNDGDILTFNTSISSSDTDETPDDNNFELNQTIVNSFDPNDKRCLEGDFITPEMVGEYVHYMIRFENTGSTEAINIVVKDHIDITKYDLSTLVPLHASHDFFAKIKDSSPDHYVEFIFEGINLPFDDANNDGYVVFKIKTLDTLALDDTFENEAEIYFDYNFPIITNIAQTTVGTLSVEDFELVNGVTLYPNPTNNILNIEANNTITSMEVYNLLGQQILTSTPSALIDEIDMSGFNSGIYLVKIKISEQITTYKIIKE